MTGLHLDALGVARAGRVLLSDLDLTLAPGSALRLIGPNGSGKSSLLRVLAGFLPAAQGAVRWHGTDIRTDLAAYRLKLHYIGARDGMKAGLSVAENLQSVGDLLGHAALAPALARMNLHDLRATPGRLLSSGQRRRLALARLIAVARPLWLLDEPGVGLDTASRALLHQAIAAHRAQGGIVIAATHGDVTLDDAWTLDLRA